MLNCSFTYKLSSFTDNKKILGCLEGFLFASAHHNRSKTAIQMYSTRQLGFMLATLNGLLHTSIYDPAHVM